MRRIFLLYIVFSMVPFAASAVSNCASLPDCQALGYSKGYDQACGTEAKNYILCPYDTQYRKCVNYDCARLGFTKTDKSSWCASVVKCKFNADYTLCAQTK